MTKIEKIRKYFDLNILLFLAFTTLKLVLFNVFVCGYIKYFGLFFVFKFFVNFVFISFVYLSLLKFKAYKSCIVFYIVQFIYLLSHMCYFMLLKNYLHITYVFNLFIEGIEAVSNLTFSFDWSFLLLLIDLPFFIIVLNKKKNITSKYVINITGFITTCLVSVCCFCLFIPAIKNSNGPWWHMPSEATVVKHYGTLVNDIFSFCFNQDENNLIKNFKYGKEISKRATKKNKPNIIILQLESIDANVIDAKYKDKYIAPYLHSLSENCVYYPYTMSYHLGGNTSDAEFSILNSIEPLQSYPAMKLPSYNYPNSFINELNKSDYTCIAFHGNVASYFNRNNAYFTMGFSNFYDIKSMHLKNKGWGASDEDVFNFAKEKLLETDKPFLSYIITLTSHASYTNFSYYYKNADYDDIKGLVGNYFNSVSYVDVTLEKFITYIQKNIPDTYIFIFGDHTPPQINDPLYPLSSMHFHSKYFEFVPLLILTPDNIVYKENKRVACFLDIAPTILNACDVKYSIRSDGNDLLNFKLNDFSLIPFKGEFFSRETLFEEITNK